MNKRRAQSTVRWIVGAAIVGIVLSAGVLLALRYLRPLVLITEAVEGPVVQGFYATGTIEPERRYSIRSNLGGTLTEVHVDKGSAVKAGNLLALVSDPELTFNEKKAQAELDERVARADPQKSPVLREFDVRITAIDELLQIARREQDRVADMIKRDAATQVDLDRAMNRVKTLVGDLEALRAARATKQLELEKDVAVARAALAVAQWNLQQQELRSPIDGVVLDRPLSVGTRVAVNELVMTVANVTLESLVMRAAVDEEDIASVQLEQLVRMTLYSYPSRTFEGRVTKIYDEADPDRRTFEVDVRLTQPPPRLAPGMTGELAFIEAERDRAVIVPSQAVQNGAVYGVHQGRIVRLDAQIGLRSVERAEVVSGITREQPVIISPIGNLSEGAPVRTRFMDPIEAANLNRPEIEDEQPLRAFN